MKRYRMTASTSHKAEAYAERVIPLLGKVRWILATRYTSTQTDRWRKDGEVRKGTVTTWREYLYVYGDKGYVRFKGVCWGYGGSGPCAVHKILTLCGLDDATARRLAFESPRLEEDGMSWEWKPEGSKPTRMIEAA